MASDFVRNIKDIRNIDILSPNITTENDLISTIDGVVYVVTKKGYQRITPGDSEQNIEVLEKDLKNLKTQSDSNTLNISGNTDDIETNTTNIGTLQTDVSNNTNDIGTLQTDVNNNTSEIEILKTSTSEIETLKTDVSNNTTNIGTLQTDVSNNTSEIETLKTSTSNNETNIDSTQTLIEQLQTQIDDLKANTKQYYTLFNGSTNGAGSTITLNDDYTTFDILYVTVEFPGGVFTETVMVKEIIDSITIQRGNLRDGTGEFLGVYEIKLTPNTNTELLIETDVAWNEEATEGSGADRNAYTILNIEGVK